MGESNDIYHDYGRARSTGTEQRAWVGSQRRTAYLRLPGTQPYQHRQHTTVLPISHSTQSGVFPFLLQHLSRPRLSYLRTHWLTTDFPQYLILTDILPWTSLTGKQFASASPSHRTYLSQTGRTCRRFQETVERPTGGFQSSCSTFYWTDEQTLNKPLVTTRTSSVTEM